MYLKFQFVCLSSCWRAEPQPHSLFAKQDWEFLFGKENSNKPDDKSLCISNKIAAAAQQPQDETSLLSKQCDESILWKQAGDSVLSVQDGGSLLNNMTILRITHKMAALYSAKMMAL
jgi:hypothetical protein